MEIKLNNLNKLDFVIPSPPTQGKRQEAKKQKANGKRHMQKANGQRQIENLRRGYESRSMR